MRMKIWAGSLSAVALAVGLAFCAPSPVRAATIPDGIYVGSQNLGGMTKEEANQTVADYVDSLSGQKITVDVSGQMVETTAKELGFHWSNPDAVDEVAGKYAGGNLVKRYMALKDLEKEPVQIPLETAVDDAMTAAFVQEKCTPLTSAPQDAVIVRENNAFKITPSVAGIVVDVEATKAALNEALARGFDQPIEAKAVVAESQPARRTEDLETISDVLGTFSTSFSSSGASRSKNLTVGAGKINGHVLMPGETLSGYECMQPFTTKNGYATAAAYENGMVVDSVGGGVCQISTTLYNAALRAELTIAQRQNHSMLVGYVDHSADAAIAGTYKDLKFTNNYSTPIYVEGYTSGKTITFTIYGKETRPANREIKFISETLKVMGPGEPIIKEDPSLAPGARRTMQSAHTGVKSRLWKYVYLDGVEQSREILHTDTYNASKAIVHVGPAAAPVVPETPAAPAETPAVPAETAPTEVGPGIPAPTQAPEETPAPAPAETPAPAPAETPAPGV